MNSTYWDRVVSNMEGSHLEDHIAAHKADKHARLIEKWSGELEGKLVLKTDLFEEYHATDSFVDQISQCELFGVDKSEEITRKVDNNYAYLNCFTADITDLPFSDEKFDLIISNSTLDNLDRKNVPKALEEINRVLKKEGVLIITVDNKDNLLYAAGLFIGQKLSLLPFFQDKCYSLSEMCKLLSSHGFDILSIDAIFHIIPPMSYFMAFLDDRNFRYTNFLSKSMIDISDKLRSKKTKFLTGRFLSFKVKKKS